MFVHPHPAFGVFANGFFEMVPDLLGDSCAVSFGGWADGSDAVPVNLLHVTTTINDGGARGTCRDR